jgi:hypothetical protein
MEDGKLMVEILDGQESFKIKPLIKSNCLAVIEGAQDCLANSLIKIWRLSPEG